MKKKLSAQITLETAIVFFVVFLMVMMFLYMMLFIHDVVVIKSSIYSIATDIDGKESDIKNIEKEINERLQKVALFVIKAKTQCVKEGQSYSVSIEMVANSNIHKINQIINQRNQLKTMRIERHMDKETLYMVNVMREKLENRKD